MATTPADDVPGSAPPPTDHDPAPRHRDRPSATDRTRTADPDHGRPADPDTPAPVEYPERAELPHAPLPPEVSPPIGRTRISGTWIAVIVAAIVLIFLLVFILQNLTTVTVQFLGFAGSLPLGVAMLFAAIAGAILIALVGTARILQLRRYAKKLGHQR